MRVALVPRSVEIQPLFVDIPSVGNSEGLSVSRADLCGNLCVVTLKCEGLTSRGTCAIFSCKYKRCVCGAVRAGAAPRVGYAAVDHWSVVVRVAHIGVPTKCH